MLHIIDRCCLNEDAEEASAVRYTAEPDPQETEVFLTGEHLLDVYVNEILTMKLICTPSDLQDLVLGRLYTEGMITSLEDVRSVYICEEGLRANVLLTKRSGLDVEKSAMLSEGLNAAEPEAGRGFRHAGRQPDFPDIPAEEQSGGESKFVDTTPSCCTGNRVLTDRFRNGAELQPVVPIRWDKSWIFYLAETFEKKLPLYQQTKGVHSALLAQKDQLLCAREDLGRHNAIDKAIGFALRNAIDLSQCILFSSGRIPTDMVEKVIRAGIPILVSKGVPTNMAVRMAKEYDLTLLSKASGSSFLAFSGNAGENN